MTNEEYLLERGWSRSRIMGSGWTPPLRRYCGRGDLSTEDAVKTQLAIDCKLRAFVDAELERRSLARARDGIGEELVLRAEGHPEPVTRPLGPPRSR